MDGRSVLIVDDNELNVRLAETVLRQAGYQIGVAHTASEARDRLAEREWSAVLMDLRLPDGNGLDIVRELRARPENAAVRVAALTASAMVGDPEAAFEAGCDAYISKPIEVRSFADQVRELMEGGDAAGSQPHGSGDDPASNGSQPDAPRTERPGPA